MIYSTTLQPKENLMNHHRFNRWGKPAALLVMFAVAMACSQPVNAAAISWTVGDIDGGSGVGDAAVSTNGSLVEAANFGDTDATNVTVNTVTFTAADFTGAYPLTNLSGLTFDAGLEGFGTSVGGGAFIDTLTDTLAFESGTSVQNTMLTGLTVGQRYEVQVFSSLNHVDRSVTVDDGLGNSAVVDTDNPIQFATGTFTADALTQTVNIDTTNTGHSLVLNGYQLRELRPVTRVDFGVSDDSPGPGSTPNDVQAGYFGLDTPHTGGSDSGSASSGSDTFNGIGVAVAGLQWRDRVGEVSGTGVDDVLEDFIYTTTTPLTLTLTGLTEGQKYVITTFHHDTTTNGGTRDSTWTIDIDGNIFSHGSVTGTNTLTPTLSDGVGMLTSTFIAGADPVVFTGTVDNSLVVLNGFTLVAIPAPSALPAGLAMLGLAAARRRRLA